MRFDDKKMLIETQSISKEFTIYKNMKEVNRDKTNYAITNHGVAYLCNKTAYTNKTAQLEAVIF